MYGFEDRASPLIDHNFLLFLKANRLDFFYIFSVNAIVLTWALRTESIEGDTPFFYQVRRRAFCLPLWFIYYIYYLLRRGTPHD